MSKGGTTGLTGRQAKKKGFYCIVTRVLYHEVSGMPNMLEMIKEKKLARAQSKRSKTVHYAVNKMWREYDEKTLSVNALLNRVSEIYNSMSN